MFFIELTTILLHVITVERFLRHFGFVGLTKGGTWCVKSLSNLIWMIISSFYMGSFSKSVKIMYQQMFNFQLTGFNMQRSA